MVPLKARRLALLNALRCLLVTLRNEYAPLCRRAQVSRKIDALEKELAG